MTPSDDDRLREVMAACLGLEPSQVGPILDQQSSPEWTSLAHLMLVSHVEAEFGIRLTSQEVVGATSYGRLQAIVHERVKSSTR
jgi:acyl carrier protein